jgi:Hydroxymethylpyrimidine/phosphomethylpyrimidine kinase
MTDVLQSTDGEWMFENKRLDTKATHGTGCTLASSTAALLAQHVALPEAVERAVAYLQGAIRNAPNYGAGHGPVDHGWRIRNAESE